MAEALGLAASVLGVVDVAVKVTSTYLKIVNLLNEAKQIPAELRAKTDKIKFLEHFLSYAEDMLSKTAVPKSTWDESLLQSQIVNCRSVLNELRDMVDQTQSRIMHPTKLRQKLALTKAVLRKEDLKALESKLDEAIRLYRLVQDQYILAMVVYSTTANTPELSRNNGKKASDVSEVAHGLNATENRTHGTPQTPQSGILQISHQPTIFGRFQFASSADGCFQVAVQTPSWIARSVYSILAHRASAGWRFHLRAYEVVTGFDWDLEQLMKQDDVQGVYRYLEEHRMSPFVRTRKGGTLLQAAVDKGAVDLTGAFLDGGLEMYAFETSNGGIYGVPWILISLGLCFESGLDGPGSRFIEMFGDLGLDDLLHNHFNLFGVTLGGIPFVGFRALTEICCFDYKSLPILERLHHFRNVVSSGTLTKAWALEELLYLLPEGRSPDAQILNRSKSESHASLVHSLALGLVHCHARREWGSDENGLWKRVLGACFRLDPSGLHHLDEHWTESGAMICTPLSAMISGWVLNCIDSIVVNELPAYITWTSLESAFRLWIDTAASSGIDLLAYGRKERNLHAEGTTTILQKFLGARCCLERGAMRFSIMGITYGALPEQWSLWVTNENYEYSADFWNMIDNQNFKVPGSWIDDVLDYFGEADDAWIWEAAPTFIWSEYRKSRPPI